jgi:hypothetical protein
MLEKKLKEVHSQIFLTQGDKQQIEKIRQEFEKEAYEEVNRVKERYMQIELDYLKTSHNLPNA